MSEPTRPLPEFDEPTTSLGAHAASAPEPTRPLPEFGEPTTTFAPATQESTPPVESSVEPYGQSWSGETAYQPAHDHSAYGQPLYEPVPASRSVTPPPYAPAAPDAGLGAAPETAVGAPGAIAPVTSQVVMEPLPDRPALPSPWERDADNAIASLPPLEETVSGVPVSPATGQPRRDPVMVVGMAFLYAAAVAAAIAFAKAWWDTIHVQGWPNSLRMLRWANVDPGSWQSVLLAVALGLLGLFMVATPAVAAFNAWNGWRWTRWAGVAAVVVSCGAILLNNLAWLALPFAVVGAVVLFLPRVQRYFDQWTRFRAGEPHEPRDVSNVFYGPLPRYR